MNLKVNVAVICERENDFGLALESIENVAVSYFLPSQVESAELDGFDAFCILGGVSAQPLCLSPKAWKRLERIMRSGKRFFVEFCRNISDGDYGPPVQTVNRRLIYLGAPLGVTETFDLLDEQCNEMITYNYVVNESFPILVSDQFVRAHYRAPSQTEYWQDSTRWALWEYCPNIRVCSFRIANFEKARFAPVQKWREVISHQMSWICGIFAPEIKFNDVYTVCKPPRMRNLEPYVKRSIRDALNWLDKSGVLIDGGRGGVYEGFNHIISNDGIQQMDTAIRCDTCGEVSMAYLMEYLRSGSSAALSRFKRLQKFMYKEFLIKTGVSRGMLRKSTFFLSSSSQDHACRAIMSTLLYAYHTKDDTNLDNACMALDFLLSVTGHDGLAGASIDSITIDKKTMQKRHNSLSNRPFPYFNGAYMAALLLAYKVTGKEEYRTTAERGMNTLIGVYPKMPRLVSETSELCRLLLPTIYLYWVTRKNEHLEFFRQLTRDLNKFLHVSGAYLEWDTGYLAPKNNKASMLATNGDPVVDLSSSLNWVPMAYSEAYRITGDDHFYKLWQNIARFFVSCQLHSDDATIDGAWTRGFDPDLMEVYGLFSDTGWRPWSIKSGWVLGQIVAGLENGLIHKPDPDTDIIKKPRRKTVK